MAEAFVCISAIQATTQLVEQSFRVLGRLRRAHQRQKALVDVISRHENELDSISTITGVIRDEVELQTSPVARELSRLKTVQSKLSIFLEKLDPKKKNAVNQFVCQLAHGSSEERTLAGIMDELVHVKGMLLLRIQVTQVGVLRTMEKKMVANADVIERIDQFLREQVDGSAGLRIAKLLKGRRPSNDGTVPLTHADLQSLARETEDEGSADETLVDDSEAPYRDSPLKTERTITRNVARQQALQINAPLGEDIWKGISKLVIEDNMAEDQTLQVNYGTTLEVFMMLFDKQEKRITSRP